MEAGGQLIDDPPLFEPPEVDVIIRIKYAK